MKLNGEWLHLSEQENALDYLEQADHHIRRTERNPIAWKWVVLTLHGALYGFAVCALRGSNPARVMYKTKRGEERLISFHEALKRCQDPTHVGMTILSKPLQFSEQQEESIRKLSRVLRNNFEHYRPMIWDIEIHGMPQIAIDVLEVIRFLALDTGNYIHLTHDERKQVESIVLRNKQVLEQSQLYKEAKLAEETACRR